VDCIVNCRRCRRLRRFGLRPTALGAHRDEVDNERHDR
jgi:hypothetical protein